jgi:hypothetical protein
MTLMTLASVMVASRPLPDRWLVCPVVHERDREEWARAASFVERVQAHRERGSRPGLFAGALARGAGPEQRWLSLVPFTTQRLFARRLALDGVSEQEFRAILGGAAAPGGDRGDRAPPWLARWLAAYGRDPVVGAPPVRTADPTAVADGIADILEPVLSDARARLGAGVRQLIATYDDCPFDLATAEALLFADLPGRLARIAARTLDLERQAADRRGDLRGATAADRWRSFFAGLRQREAALAFFREYPLLARQLSDCLERWAASGFEFLRHLCEDWPAIRNRFNPGAEPGGLIEIAADIGEQRHHGRAPIVARFASGLRLVYKPRPVALDAHFQELIDWINRRGPRFDFRSLTVLDCGDHGWLEHVGAGPCDSTAALDRFHWRQGGYLALGYAFDAANFRHGDLVAAGEQPMLAEPAQLFQPPPGQLFADDTATTDGAAPAQRPACSDGSDWPDRDRHDAVDAGYAAMLRLLTDHRDALLAEDGPVARFADDEVGIMPRPAAVYEQLLREARQPENLCDGLDRDRLFDRLWAVTQHSPRFDPLIGAEQAALRRGDVPLLLGRPGSMDLRDAAGTNFAGLLPESVLARIRRRLLSLGERDPAPPAG